MASKFLTRPSTWAAGTALLSLTIATTTYNRHSHQRIAYADSPSGTSTSTSNKPYNFSSFTSLKLSSTEQVTHNVKRLRFALPTPTDTANVSVITSLLSRHTPEGAWIPVFRPYTPIIVDTPDDPGHVTFLIKKYPGGRASGKMHNLVPGEEIQFKALKEFQYVAGEQETVLCVAGGSGITPIYQLVGRMLGQEGNGEADKTRVQVVYANNSPGDVLLKKEWEELAAKYPERLGVTFMVSKGGDGPGEEGFKKGYVTKELLERVMPMGIEGGKGVKVLVSGPPAMTAAVAGKKGGFGWAQGSIGGILKELGYTKEQVYKF